ncbi:unnamed protein product [Phytophthora lilii]|uniref:Unnamed protein product n=1 Tax=Phytophthora lilii TaxID=2077276 RepID=A0A9W6THT0_9STRA|nr:unnamed protein product [Phytophthora lilii]
MSKYSNKYDDASFQKTFNVQNSGILALLMSIYTSKESLILTLNAMCKMVKNRYRDSFAYYNTIRKELSKQNKAAKLDNELTPEEEKKYISYEELMSVPGKVKKVLTETYVQWKTDVDEHDSTIAESHIIQSPVYAKLTNREKNDLHAKLLHSTMAANTSYNKVANLANAPEPEVSFEPEPASVATPAANL